MRRKNCFTSRTAFLAVVSVVLLQCNLGSAIADGPEYVDRDGVPTAIKCWIASLFGRPCETGVFVENESTLTGPLPMTTDLIGLSKRQENRLRCGLFLTTGKGLSGKMAKHCLEKGRPSKHPRIKKVLKLLVPNT